MPFYLPEALLLEARLQRLAGSAAALVTRTLRDAVAIAHRQQTLLTERRARAALVEWSTDTRRRGASEPPPERSSDHLGTL
jgi:hypothetical protein